MAGAGASSRRIALLALGHELIQKLVANLGLQGRLVLMDLWVVAG
jgi:hypothetical protein